MECNNMYFQRKIDFELDLWLKKNERTPVLIVGIRQCGKLSTYGNEKN